MRPRDLVRAILDYRPPTKLQPIARRAFDRYYAAGWKLTDDGLSLIEGELASHDGDLKLLTDALFGLVPFLILLRDRFHDEAAIARIVEIMKSTGAAYEPLARAVADALYDLGGDFLAGLERFSDRDQSAKLRAPVYDTAPPPNTLPLRDLKPISRRRG
jgi:hypothetical protein